MAVTVEEILRLMDTLAPPALKMDWDHVGLQCGDRHSPVHRVLVALDPFEHVCQEAVERQADLLVTHHPLIFHPIDRLTEDYAISRGIRNLCRHNISHICAHTNLDRAPGGVNDVLAKTLALTRISPIPQDEAQLLRMGLVPEQPLEAFLSRVKTLLSCPMLRYCDAGKPVRKVAVGGGACADEMDIALAAGCDTFVTSDVKYNGFWDAKDAGLNLIDAGHFYTENPVTTYLAEQLRLAFPELEVIVSEKHEDCMKFY